MDCPRGHHNDDGFAFCGTCGAALAAPPRAPSASDGATYPAQPAQGYVATGYPSAPQPYVTPQSQASGPLGYGTSAYSPPGYASPGQAPKVQKNPRNGLYLMGVVLLAVVAVGIVAVNRGSTGGSVTPGSGTSTSTTSSDDRTTTVTATFEFSGASGSCYGTGGYSDIGSGTQVIITDQTGEILGTSQLGAGSPGALACTFSMTFPRIPTDRTFYSFEVGRRGKITHSLSEMEASGWEFGGSLG